VKVTQRFFLRLDDWFRGTEAERHTLRWLVSHGYKVHVAVVPGLLTKQGSTYLRTEVDEHPDCIEVGQHGYLHTCRNFGRKRFEVGPGMACDEQAVIIAAGARMLQDKLEMATTRVFTPPFNGYDANTLSALRDNGFEVLSAAVRRPVADTQGIRLVPVNVDLCAQYFPSPRLSSLNQIVATTRFVCLRDGFVGVVFHPTLTPLNGQWLEAWSWQMRTLGLTRSVMLSSVEY
jgi:hypothetical protein